MIKDISANRDQQVEMQVKIRDNAKSISLLDNTEQKFKTVNAKISKKLNIDDYENGFANVAYQDSVENVDVQLQQIAHF